MKKLLSLLLLALTISLSTVSCVPGTRYRTSPRVVVRRWRVRLENRESGKRRTFFVRARHRSRAIRIARNRAENRWGNRGILIWARR